MPIRAKCVDPVSHHFDENLTHMQGQTCAANSHTEQETSCDASVLRADLVFDYCYAFAMAFSQNVVQQSCLSRTKKASDDLHRSITVCVLPGSNKVCAEQNGWNPTVTGIRVSTTGPSMSMISGSTVAVAGAGAGGAFGLAAFFVLVPFACAERCLPDFALAWARTRSLAELSPD